MAVREILKMGDARLLRVAQPVRAFGTAELAALVDGIGPSLGLIVTWPDAATKELTTLVNDAHAVGLVVHPYTIRVDELPKNCPSVDALHAALLREAGADGVFTDFTDVTRAWLKK